jgi:hypothetical protein
VFSLFRRRQSPAISEDHDVGDGLEAAPLVWMLLLVELEEVLDVTGAIQIFTFIPSGTCPLFGTAPSAGRCSVRHDLGDMGCIKGPLKALLSLYKARFSKPSPAFSPAPTWFLEVLLEEGAHPLAVGLPVGEVGVAVARFL